MEFLYYPLDKPMMKKEKSEHPTYPNPTLVETLCELHFDAPGGPQDHLQWFGDFFHQIRGDFPKMEPQQILEMGAKVGRGGIVQEIKVPSLRMMFRHKTRAHLLLLSPGVLSINELKPYPGWTQFIKDIQFAWKTLESIVKPQTLRRIGLRYINRISKKKTDEPVKAWLKESPLFPLAILEQCSTFLNRFDHQPEAGFRQIITLGSEPGQAKHPDNLIFDIDTIMQKALPWNWSPVVEQLATMHDRIWAAFSSARTPKYIKLLEEEPKP